MNLLKGRAIICNVTNINAHVAPWRSAQTLIMFFVADNTEA
ncbi:MULTISPECIES: hypothetical protein [Pediococcus]|nr:MULTISPECIES: hypothetical protein [Pediococcus]